MSIDWSFTEVADESEVDYFVWTAPEALRCGDRLALYEGGRANRSAFVAVGRAVTDSVRAHRGDRRHWAWVQWLPLENPMPLAEVERKIGYRHVSGSHVSVDEARFKLWGLLVREHARDAVIATWKAREGFPTTDEVPIHQLFDAKWRYRPRHEVAMYEHVLAALVREGWQRAPDELSRLVRAMRGGTPTRPDGEQRRLPDVWALERRRRSLVIVEVKRHARHQPGRDYDPVDQVLNYVDTAAATLSDGPFRRLAIRPMIVAYEINAAERKHARPESVDCRLLTRRTHELKRV
jgi:hypothetical protein